MTTVVTGFEPFGGAGSNASELVVTALAASEDPGLATAVLPTSYRRAEAGIGDLLRSHRPRRVLMLGLADGALEDSRAILREYGNMSAPTVLFVLERAVEGGMAGRHLMAAVGPGFTAGFMLLEGPAEAQRP